MDWYPILQTLQNMHSTPHRSSSGDSYNIKPFKTDHNFLLSIFFGLFGVNIEGKKYGPISPKQKIMFVFALVIGFVPPPFTFDLCTSLRAVAHFTHHSPD